MSALFFDRGVTFSSLPLDGRVFKALARLHYVYPSLVQSRVIPLALQGNDILCKARTGAGKTLAYAVPIIQNILVEQDSQSKSNNNNKSKRGIRAIVLVPSKELVEQVHKAFQPLLYYCTDTISICSLTGETPHSLQIPQLKEQPEIIISTPTRLIEHLKSGVISIKNSLQMLVLDEADLLLSFGYSEELRSLLDYAPKLKQSILMSATLNSEIETLKSLVLHNPSVIKLEENEHNGSNTSLQEFYVECSKKDKLLLSYTLLKLKLLKGKCLFYTNSNETSFRLKLFLELFSISSAVLNENLPYNSRKNILNQFNRGVFDYLIATDNATEYDSNNIEENEEGEEENNSNNNNHLPKITVEDESQVKEEEKEDEAMSDNEEEEIENYKTKRKNKKEENKLKKEKEFNSSRGLDFQDVSTVINYDMPTSYKAYTHRIGRTARGGKTGTALSLVAPDEAELLSTILHSQLTELSQSNLHAEPSLKALPLNLSDIEGFRYRVEDISRAVTGAAIKEAMLKDLKLELINSEKLKAHFEDNPRELDLLKHDKVLRPKKIQKHLKHIPDYLIPAGLTQQDIQQSTNKLTKSKRKRDAYKLKQQQSTESGRQKVKSASDPLRNFTAPDSAYNNNQVSFRDSSAGRKQWKERHNTGKNSQKKKRSKVL